MEREIQIYEHHQDGESICCLCGEYPISPGLENSCGVVLRSTTHIGEVCDACTSAAMGSYLMDYGEVVGEY